MSIVYLVPLWRIHLGAPQYPEGLSMYIWTSNISGGDEFDLQNINFNAVLSFNFGKYLGLDGQYIYIVNKDNIVS